MNRRKKQRRMARLVAFAALAALIVYGAVGRARSGPSGDVNVRSSLSQTKIVQGTDGLVTLQIEMESPEGSMKSVRRKPIDFVIVLDRSGSMADTRKMDYAKKAVASLIGQLREGDRFALVDFDHVIGTPIPLSPVNESAKRRFLSALRGIEPRGATNLGGGLIRGIEEVKTIPRRDGQAQRLVLISDGLANEGIVDPADLNRIASRAATGAFSISTIGVGLDFNESLLASLADYGTGNYTFLEDLAVLDKVLAQELYGASRIHASDLKMELNLAHGVDVTDVSGYPVAREGNLFVIRPGPLYQGQKKTLFATLRLPTDAVYSKSLGRGTLSYRIQGSDPSRTVALFGEELKVACLSPDREREAIASIVPGTFREAWSKNNYGKLLKDNADKIRAGDRSGALGVLHDYKGKLSQAYQAAPSPELKRQLDEVERMEGEVNDAFTGPDAATKSKRLSKGYQYQGIRQQRPSN